MSHHPFWDRAAGPANIQEALAAGIQRIRDWKPGSLCGSKERPHLISPRPSRWPVCVTCGAGYADAALAADMEASGIDTSTWPNIAGTTGLVPEPPP